VIGNDHEINNYTTSVAKQRLSKEACFYGNNCIATEELFSTQSVPRCYKQSQLADRFPGRKGIPHNHVDLCHVCDTYTWQRRSIFIRDKPILYSEKMLRKDYDSKDSVEKISLIVSLKGLGAKTN
jgi:hypothetical protein